MKIISWNIRRAGRTSQVWEILCDLDPDIALLQEVADVPENIRSLFDIKIKKAVKKNGEKQKFSTAVLVKGRIVNDLFLQSEYDWVNKELEHFSGNLVGCVARPGGYSEMKVVSVYSPAWPIDTEKLGNVDISIIKLKQNPNLWVTEILWSALKKARIIKNINNP